MNNINKVSVIISIYNIENYIEECINSIIQQEYKNLEIICVNDDSTDKSLKILNKYALIDDRIIIINQKNQGLSATRNVGIKKATGKYIYFIDGDDFISKNYIKNMVEIIQKENTKVAHNPNYINYYGHNDERNLKINIHTKTAFNTNTITHSTWSKLFDLNFLRNTNLKFKDQLLHQDYEFWNKFIAHIDIMSFSKSGTYYYRQRDNSIIDKARKQKKYNNHILICIRSISNYYSKNKNNLNFKPLYISVVNDHLYYHPKKYRIRFILETLKTFKSFDQRFIKYIKPGCIRTYNRYTKPHKIAFLILSSLLKK